MGRWCVFALYLAGCDQLWNLQHVDESDGAVDGTVAIACPNSYYLTAVGSSSHYRYSNVPMAWTDAEAACEADSPMSHLVVVDDDNERAALLLALGRDRMYDSFWIGYTDRRLEDTFLWVTNQGVGDPPRGLPPWAAGQPDDFGGDQDCVWIGGAGSPTANLFDDGGCTLAFNAVCECDALPAAPDNF